MRLIKSIASALMFSFSISSFASSSIEDLYTAKIQPIFDARCISCHSCFNAPCQLNLQNYEGFIRGANKLNIYDGSRRQSVEPSRLWIDMKTAHDWMDKRNFYSLNESNDPEKNLFYQTLAMKMFQKDLAVKPKKQVGAGDMCPANSEELANFQKMMPESGMPYGLPALSGDELGVIKDWISLGAPGPSEAALKQSQQIPSALATQIKEWEKFLNAKDLKHRLVSRYLYEHKFLAHLYFPEEPRTFFRLVRSSKACEKGVDEIATRRPNDDPGKSFHYCFQKFPGTIVMKTHLPFELSPQKLKKYQEIFFAVDWKVNKLPSYENSVAENPFIAFKDIPEKARYRYLLEDAQYQVATFIKGPVCNGSMAVNSIQEQFWVYFLNPDSDNMVLSQSYANRVKDLLILPGMWGSDVALKETLSLGKQLVEHREAYRKERAKEYQKLRPKGYSLKDLWDGDGVNSNAVLTVLRHDDNAVIKQGMHGDLPKTSFVLDYPLMERLVYNLVVNFDVFGNIGHQMLTRVYMDMIRMEAEDLYLSFLPAEQRLALRKSWYKGILAEVKMSYVFPLVAQDFPTGIQFKNNDVQAEFAGLVYKDFKPEVRGLMDHVNVKNAYLKNILGNEKMDAVTKALSKVTSKRSVGKKTYARYFPEFSYLLIKDDGKERVFSIILNREHDNISWILGEGLRLSPLDNNLMIKEGFWGSYPVQFYSIEAAEVESFVKAMRAINSHRGYQKFVQKFGVRRTSPRFWRTYDSLHEVFKSKDPVEFGFIDLTRYSLE